MKYAYRFKSTGDKERAIQLMEVAKVDINEYDRLLKLGDNELATEANPEELKKVLPDMEWETVRSRETTCGEAFGDVMLRLIEAIHFPPAP